MTQYTHGHDPATVTAHNARTAANSAAHLLPHLAAGMSVLDIGCGPGSITLDLAEHVAPGTVIGIDNVASPLVAARAAATQRGDLRTRFEQADVTALPFADDTFDVSHAHQVLQHLADPVAALREMRRVTRPGGWIAVRDADYAAMNWFPRHAGLQAWCDTYRAAARANGAEPDAGRHLRAWARAAGLTEVEITTSTWTYATEDSCRWWGDSWQQRVDTEHFRRQARQQGRTEDDIARIREDWRRWAASPDAWFVVVHTELLARA